LRTFKQKSEIKQTLFKIIDRIKANDPKAKEEFVVFISPHLRKVANKLSITTSELQSSIDWVLTKIINNIEKLDSQKNALTYITNSIRNYCIDEYRKVCVRQRKENQFKQLNSTRVNSLEHSIDFLIEDICKNDEEQVVLRKIIFDKASIQDIAKDTNIPVKKIKSLLDRVRTEYLP
jgi:RNA polymerase sigma factor (sigma-70 family)